MAPRLPQRTPTLPTDMDTRYACVNSDCPCSELEELDLDDHVNRSTWTCIECNCPVSVDMANDWGEKCTVYRYQAQQLKKRDYIYKGKNLVAVEVTGSSATDVEGRWYFALAGHKYEFVEPDRYYNCMPTGHHVR
ncbi:hypothetical protein ALQ37_02810 [Pseudomonas syringae pv. aptata]|uniref:Uncharacterized protein n=2 Tax=Pseudomonas syringae TaxID=317 RepID=A0A0Q0DAI4_PSEAP|nr:MULTISPECIES: hypothetical protein [Pseudomonas]KPZ04106.1 hypothetical protein ALO85_200122 [Pseudomonas syringae pv. aptata]RMO62914.1 hypothetical protein ALQ37_02810 [Pseudomonas syringae pv. aptata]